MTTSILSEHEQQLETHKSSRDWSCTRWCIKTNPEAISVWKAITTGYLDNFKLCFLPGPGQYNSSLSEDSGSSLSEDSLLLRSEPGSLHKPRLLPSSRWGLRMPGPGQRCKMLGGGREGGGNTRSKKHSVLGKHTHMNQQPYEFHMWHMHIFNKNTIKHNCFESESI